MVVARSEGEVKNCKDTPENSVEKTRTLQESQTLQLHHWTSLFSINLNLQLVLGSSSITYMAGMLFDFVSS